MRNSKVELKKNTQWDKISDQENLGYGRSYRLKF